MNIKEKFGRQVSTLRNEKALSQKDLADLSGLHWSYISSTERGERNLCLENIEKISNALKLDIKELFNFEQQ